MLVILWRGNTFLSKILTYEPVCHYLPLPLILDQLPAHDRLSNLSGQLPGAILRQLRVHQLQGITFMCENITRQLYEPFYA
jgi:hypothetical protein